MAMSKYQEAKRARRLRKEAGLARAAATRQSGNYTVPCVRCGNPGPGKKFGRIRICKGCWKSMTLTERLNVAGLASRVG